MQKDPAVKDAMLREQIDNLATAAACMDGLIIQSAEETTNFTLHITMVTKLRSEFKPSLTTEISTVKTTFKLGSQFGGIGRKVWLNLPHFVLGPVSPKFNLNIKLRLTSGRVQANIVG